MSALAPSAPLRAYRPSPVRRLPDISQLYPRTLMVARHLAGGFTEKEIGFVLGVGRGVIARERARFMEATGAITLRDIVLACRAHGLDPA